MYIEEYNFNSMGHIWAFCQNMQRITICGEKCTSDQRISEYPFILSMKHFQLKFDILYKTCVLVTQE